MNCSIILFLHKSINSQSDFFRFPMIVVLLNAPVIANLIKSFGRKHIQRIHHTYKFFLWIYNKSHV